MKYLKIWTSFLDVISPLEYDEIGRLFEMMLTYAETGKEPEQFIGNELFLWPAAKQQIDLTAEKNEILRQNGRKGGRPKSKQNQPEPKQTKQNQSEPDESCKEKERKEKERNEKESFIDDNNAREIQAEQDKVLSAAENAGFARSDAVRAKLLNLYADHGLQKVLEAIDSCVVHGAANIAYLSAVLKGEPKKKPMTRAVSAQAYEQRNYDGEQEEAMRRMVSKMEAAHAG